MTLCTDLKLCLETGTLSYWLRVSGEILDLELHTLASRQSHLVEHLPVMESLLNDQNMSALLYDPPL